jgi:hypothetical protein
MVEGFDFPVWVWVIIGVVVLFVFSEIISDGLAILVSRLPLVIGGVMVYVALTQAGGYSLWLLALGAFFVVLGFWNYDAR